MENFQRDQQFESIKGREADGSLLVVQPRAGGERNRSQGSGLSAAWGPPPVPPPAWQLPAAGSALGTNPAWREGSQARNNQVPYGTALPAAGHQHQRAQSPSVPQHALATAGKPAPCPSSSRLPACLLRVWQVCVVLERLLQGKGQAVEALAHLQAAARRGPRKRQRSGGLSACPCGRPASGGHAQLAHLLAADAEVGLAGGGRRVCSGDKTDAAMRQRWTGTGARLESRHMKPQGGSRVWCGRRAASTRTCCVCVCALRGGPLTSVLDLEVWGGGGKGGPKVGLQARQALVPARDAAVADQEVVRHGLVACRRGACGRGGERAQAQMSLDSDAWLVEGWPAAGREPARPACSISTPPCFLKPV